MENFPITGIPISIYPDLINALASIKEAAALANDELGLLDRAHTEAIVAACQQLRAGRLHDQFTVDVIQGGAGTSTNMNANEVIANRAIQIAGGVIGAMRALSRANGKSVSVSVRRGLNIETIQWAWPMDLGRPEQSNNAGGRGLCRAELLAHCMKQISQ